MTLEIVVTFILSSILISLAPGPDNIFVLTQSALYGRASGLWVTLGLCTGLIFHTAAVALGVAALLAASPFAFNALKYAGAAYLIYLAWQVFRVKPALQALDPNTGLSSSALYVRGIIMNVTNPKVSIFFLAFIPQFTNSDSNNVAFQFIVLGLIFIAVAFVVFNLIVLMAGTLGTCVAQSKQGQIYLNRIAGIVFIVLAVKLIASSV